MKIQASTVAISVVGLFLSVAPILSYAAVYKCQEGGRTVYQERPCTTGGYPVLSDDASTERRPQPEATPVPAPTAKALADVDKLRANVNKMENERRQREVGYAIRDLYAEIANLEQGQERELAQLELSKQRSNNSYAGAMRDQSISTQMQAVTEKYRNRIQIAQDKISRLERQQDELRRQASLSN